MYATGDVTGMGQFVYMAAYGAKLVAKNAMNGNTLSYGHSVMPAVDLLRSASGKRWSDGGTSQVCWT